MSDSTVIRIDGSATDDDPQGMAQIVAAVSYGRDPTGTGIWRPIAVDTLGRLEVVVDSLPAAGIDVSDRAARLLGHVTVDSLPAVNVSDRAGRLLGVVNSITNPVDVADRVARLLGVVNSITNPVDVSDRAARLLGVINSVTNPVDISDRAARLAGVVTSNSPDNADVAASAAGAFRSTAEQFFWNPATPGWERVRTPTWSASINATAAGATLVKAAPGAGSSLRILGYSYFLTGNAILGVAGVDLIDLRDNVTSIGGTMWRPFIPAAAANVLGGATFGPWNLPGNGYKLAANVALNVNLGVAITGGFLVVNVWGCTE